MKFIRTAIYRIPVSPALQETILEALRLAVIAFVSTFVTILINYVKTLPNPEIWIMILTLILRSLDKYKYIGNKENKVPGEKNLGLVGF